jgi:hypothetical protein
MDRVERCQRCGGPVDLESRTVVLSSDPTNEMREHVYCSSACAVAMGTPAAVALDAIAEREAEGGGLSLRGRDTRCPACFELVTLGPEQLVRLADASRRTSVVCMSCGERLRLDGETGRLATVDR